MIYFIACIIVLSFLVFVIRRAAGHDEKPQRPPEGQNAPEEEKRQRGLPLIK